MTHGTDDPASGAVLVAGTLYPGIGALLPCVNGLAAETGSVLAHLAILAREGGGHGGRPRRRRRAARRRSGGDGDGRSGAVTIERREDEEDERIVMELGWVLATSWVRARGGRAHA